ncbi:MAG: hypothetical protein MZW92_13195 [Comamonadaceae bacterium]|nr:hypothetical protein [Comamonadaceae bacterium]
MMRLARAEALDPQRFRSRRSGRTRLPGGRGSRAPGLRSGHRRRVRPPRHAPGRALCPGRWRAAAPGAHQSAQQRHPAQSRPAARSA